MSTQKNPATIPVIYSPIVKGNRSNWYRDVRFDKSEGGYIGISQWDGEGELTCDRILLTPAQLKALIAFARTTRRKTAKTRRSQRASLTLPRRKEMRRDER